VVATVSALLTLVTANVLLGQTGFTVQELQRSVSEKSTDVEQLDMDVERLRSPARIAAEAQKLGLGPGTEVIVIAPRKTSDVRGPSPARGRP
jgi:cell division protein FtsL